MKTFPPLDPDHAAFLRDRAEPYLAANPGLDQLRQELLSHGGLDVVWVSPEPHLEPLLERGRLHPKRCLRRRFIADSQCHANASSLWYESEGRIRVGRGYAISERGLWFQHSWGVEDGRIIETTSTRWVRYFGFGLTDSEAWKFALGNSPIGFKERVEDDAHAGRWVWEIIRGIVDDVQSGPAPADPCRVRTAISA
jgi:hypothetical protein